MYPEEDIRPYADALQQAVEKEDTDAIKALGDELFGLGGMTAMHKTHRVYTRLYGDHPKGAPRLVDMAWRGIGQWLG